MVKIMKRLAGFLWLGFLAFNLSAGTRGEQWKKVQEAMDKGLPKTAIEALDPIIQGALQDQAYGEAAKAMLRKILMEGNVQGNRPEEKITRLEAAIAKAPKEIVPLLTAVQANWYWNYFLQNRWRFMQRTRTAEAPGKDFTTWDLPRIFAEIDRHFSRSLSNPELLQKTPISTFADLLQAGTMPDACRPTLYDFLASEALRFYASGEQAGAKAEDAFELAATSAAGGLPSPLASAGEFMAAEPPGASAKPDRAADHRAMMDSPAGKAYWLYRDLLRFHRNDADKSAFVDTDLNRLTWAYGAAVGEDKKELYLKALAAFVKEWGDHEISARADHEWAKVWQADGRLAEARQRALRGAQAFPGSIGGKMCRNLIAQIEAKSAAVITERIWTDPWPKIQVRYRNITNVFFRAVPYDWNVLAKKQQYRPDFLNDAERKTLLNTKAAREWPATLPPTPDYRERTAELPADTSLAPGFYYLLASFDPSFSDQDNVVSFTPMWVSKLALVIRSQADRVDGFVLEAKSGEPVSGASVQYRSQTAQGKWTNSAPVATDTNGCFSLPAKNGRSLLIWANYRDQQIGSAQDFGPHGYPPEPNKAREQTVFFTDRALYRPGQIVQYKGICLRINQAKDNYEIIRGRTLTVVFEDPNAKEIARQNQAVNEFGSFSGSFVAPRDRLTGAMRLRIDGGPEGETLVFVEEYKQPKFQVTLNAPKTAPKLDQPVAVQGKAESYTGAALDQGQVKWRVVREVRWPDWWGGWGWRQPRGAGSQEIAHGTARTEVDGTFKIEFTARPDRSLSPTNEPSFQFTVNADVTDSTGETRSAHRTVEAGYTALRATVSAGEWQTDAKPVELQLLTTTLDGEPQTAEGSLRVHRLQEPAAVARQPLPGETGRFHPGQDDRPASADWSDPNQWALAAVVMEKGFTTDAKGKATIQAPLKPGVYRVLLETQDRFGKKVTARLPLQVLQPADTSLGIKIPSLFTAPDWSLEPGAEFEALWGTGYAQGRAYVEIEHRNKVIRKYWTPAGQTQHLIRQAVTDKMRGGFILRVTQVRENRAYLHSRSVAVPWTNKELELRWEHLTSKLQPNQKETWTAVITRQKEAGAPKSGPDSQAERTVAEMVATLYDQSLDQFRVHYWPKGFDIFRQNYSPVNAQFQNGLQHFEWLKGRWTEKHTPVQLSYRTFPSDLVANWWNYGALRATRSLMSARGAAPMAAPMVMDSMSMDMAAAPPAAAPMMAKMAAAPQEARAYGLAALPDSAGGMGGGGAPPPAPKPVDLAQVVARKNLAETAFFYPHLTSDTNGEVRLTFTTPETLTTWRFLGFAHDKQVRSGFLEGKAVSSKEVMIQPNPPRFLREKDTVEFTAKVSNQSAARQTGKVRLSFNFAADNQSADRSLGNLQNELDFDIPAQQSRSFSWRITVPDGCGFLSYKAVAATGRLSDGEEGYLPVLSRRILVTESLPLPIRGPATKQFRFKPLLDSAKSSTLVSQNLVLQMVSNPAWYAVMALPYLMEFPHECNEQLFNRFYANALARFIAQGDPKIRRVFDLWKNTPALDSPLEKNQDLKAVALEETPWLRQAQQESQARKNLGLLFDENRLNYESENTLRKLTEAQLADGAWSWFPGGHGNDYITLYITTGFGRLRHLGLDLNPEAAIKSLRRLDGWMAEHHAQIQKGPHPEQYVPSATDALYLYGRSFYLKDQAVAPEPATAVNFFLQQARKHWLQTGNRQSQGHLALALHRWGGAENRAAAQGILKSLKERSVTNEEMGRFWRDTELSWWWYRAPIETQALMIEAFDEVMADTNTVEECRVWLLKQKQTQDWKTTKATADAIYALLLRGRDLLASDALVEVSLGGKDFTPKARTTHAEPAGVAAAAAVEPGTGFYEVRFAQPDIQPALGNIQVRKTDIGVAWGSLHWQYLEDMTQVKPYAGTPLQLKKSLFTRVNTAKGPVLEPVKGSLQVGGELVVRIELRVDRDMEYVHLKDHRGSGTEPVNVLSSYRYQDGLAYYESTKDTASHFFIDYLPKGVYVFEYASRIQLRGAYQTGMASIQCMYAPEFNSHSESHTLTVK